MLKLGWIALAASLMACSSDDHDLGGSGGSAGNAGTAGDAGSSGSSGNAGQGGGGGADACTQAGGSVSTVECCTSTGDFPDMCAVGACSCGPGNTHPVQICNCPSGCWNGSQCVGAGGNGGGGGSAGSSGAAGAGGNGGAAESCVASGGTVTSGLCCTGAGDFPNSCLVGACGCSPENSHSVQQCQCPSGKCFDGVQCI